MSPLLKSCLAPRPANDGGRLARDLTGEQRPPDDPAFATAWRTVARVIAKLYGSDAPRRVDDGLAALEAGGDVGLQRWLQEQRATRG